VAGLRERRKSSWTVRTFQNVIAGKVIVGDHFDYRGAWENNWNQLRTERYRDVLFKCRATSRNCAPVKKSTRQPIPKKDTL
jgi:hypothetical protein